MFYVWLGISSIVSIAVAYLIFRQEYFYRVKDFLHSRATVLQSKWRMGSRMFGNVASAEIPEFIRRQVLTCYVKYYGIDMADVKEQDLNKYKSLNEFINRPLKESARPIADALLISPADCNTNHFGQVDEVLVIENVKGNDYHLDDFLGKDIVHQIDEDLKKKQNTALFYCICYLSPADYHGFHSPTDWTIKFRRHFTGALLSVREPAVGSIPDLFDINERMLLTGEWEHGFFSVTAVGAKKVGGIEFDFDHRHTNLPDDPLGSTQDRQYDPPIKKKKGQYFGKFIFGSTMVLVFQAPSRFQFNVSKGEKVKYGQAMGKI